LASPCCQVTESPRNGVSPMEHGLVAWPSVHLIRTRLETLTHTGVVLTRMLREWLGLDLLDAHTRRLESPFDAIPRSIDARTPQPLASFPVLRALVSTDPWFADPGLRVQRVWERVGWAGQRCAFFIAHSGEPTAGLLVRGLELAYCRLYPAYTLAALDALFWSREVETPPDP